MYDVKLYKDKTWHFLFFYTKMSETTEVMNIRNLENMQLSHNIIKRLWVISIQSVEPEFIPNDHNISQLFVKKKGMSPVWTCKISPGTPASFYINDSLAATSMPMRGTCTNIKHQNLFIHHCNTKFSCSRQNLLLIYYMYY